MARERDEAMPLPGQPADTRLSPAEVHDIVRHRLGRLGLRAADVHRLARGMHRRVFDPGEIIVRRGARADCLGVVVRGQVAVHVGSRTAARLVVVLLAGSTFGEAMLAGSHPSHATLQALTRCEVGFLRAADLQALLQEYRQERQRANLLRLVRAGGTLFLVLLLALLILRVPAGRTALSLAPMALGQWCQEAGYDACAEASWQIAANLAPADVNPLLALGNLYFDQQNVADAERTFEQVRALAPDLPEAYNNLGMVYALQGYHEQAVAAFRHALELEPGVAATENNLALSLQALKQEAEALEHYRLAVALDEPQASTLANMAIAYYELGQPVEATAAAREALTYDKTLAAAYVVLGAVALQARQPEIALPDLQRAVALDGVHPQGYFFLGLAYKSLGRPVEATSAFEQALATAGDEMTRTQIRRHLQELYDMRERSQSQ
jgi:tetratricopeptide (TPR) repeat protein